MLVHIQVRRRRGPLRWLRDLIAGDDSRYMKFTAALHFTPPTGHKETLRCIDMRSDCDV